VIRETRGSVCVITLLLCATALFGQTALSPDLQLRIEHQVRSFAEAPPDAKIALLPRHSSEFPNFDVQPVEITSGGATKKFDFLLSKDGTRLLYVTGFDLTSDSYQRAMSKIDVGNRPVRGNPNAPVTIVVFDDLQCPFCARLYQQLVPVVVNEYPDRVRLILKDATISPAHQWAVHAAIDANCLASQSSAAYWDFTDYVHTHQSEFNGKFAQDKGQSLDELALARAEKRGGDAEKLRSCISTRDATAIGASLKEGQALSLTATPTMFINGQEYEGVLAAAQIRAAIELALREAAQKQAQK
jgi:protein-disulfide isomerase